VASIFLKLIIFFFNIFCDSFINEKEEEEEKEEELRWF